MTCGKEEVVGPSGMGNRARPVGTSRGRKWSKGYLREQARSWESRAGSVLGLPGPLHSSGREKWTVISEIITWLLHLMAIMTSDCNRQAPL